MKVHFRDIAYYEIVNDKLIQKGYAKYVTDVSTKDKNGKWKKMTTALTISELDVLMNTTKYGCGYNKYHNNHNTQTFDMQDDDGKIMRIKKGGKSKSELSPASSLPSDINYAEVK